MKRRDFLTGLGTASVLSPFVPLLEARGAPSAFPKRAVFFYTNVGMTPRYPGNWKPTGTEADWSFGSGSLLEALNPYKDKLLVFQGIDLVSVVDSPAMGGHPVGNLNCLTASPGLRDGNFTGGGPESGGWASAVSIDQYLAQQLGKDSPFPSLLLGIRVRGSAAPSSRISFAAASQPVPPENSPYAAFDRVFGMGVTGKVGGDPALLMRLRAEKRSVLDVVRKDLDALNAKLGADGKRKIEAHLTGLRALETRLSAPIAPSGSCTKPTLGNPIDFMNGRNVPVVGDLQMQVAAAALACGQTKFVTLQWGSTPGGVGSDFMSPALSGEWHTLSHMNPNATNLTAMQDLDRMARWQADQFVKMVKLLSAVREGDGTLLDNTALIWLTEVSDPNKHDWRNMPYVIAGGMGGTWRTGRYLTYPGAPTNRLWTSLCHGMGLTGVATFGSPKYGTGPLPSLI